MNTAMARGLGDGDLPDDVLTEVFSYLPAKSAGRFRALSRSWRATLSSMTFAHLHLQRTTKPGEIKVFFSLPDGTSEEESSHGNAPEEESCNDDGTPEEEDGSCDDGIEEPYFYAWQPGGAVKKLAPNYLGLGTLTRPLHGLVLMRNTRYHVVNPSTGAALALPDSSNPSAKQIRRPLWYYLKHVAYGLGYCAVTGDYKAVRIFSNEASHEFTQILCEVFVLGKLAYWRYPAQDPPVCVIKEENPGVFLSGYLHFLCLDGEIIAFDITAETFGSVLPPPYLEDAGPIIKMTELNGCLCVCHGELGYSDKEYHIWVLTNYKEGEWEQIYRFDPTYWAEPDWTQLDCSWIAPLCMYTSEDGTKKIMFDTGNCKVFTMDVMNGNTPEILFNPDDTMVGRFEDFTEPRLGLFEESLVPVGCTIEEMVLSCPKTKAWFDILKWMPTRHVADLSLVCRGWHAMVKDDNFVRSHVAHANLNKSPRITMIQDTLVKRCCNLEDVINGTEGCQLFLHLVCSQPCHGLNAGTHHSHSFVYNPVGGHGENIMLDGVDDVDDLDDVYDGADNVDDVDDADDGVDNVDDGVDNVDDVDNGMFFAGQTGLGYDAQNNKHVIVLITYKQKNLATREYQLECKLRYVNKKKCHSVDPPPRPIADVPPTWVDGKIFWLVDPNLGPVSQKCEIVSFDVETKEFQVLGGPPCSSYNDGNMSILQLQGALCVACSDKRSNALDIWMMKDAGIWSMEYHIELEEFSPQYSWEKTTPLAIDPTDGRILLSTGRSLGYIDPKTGAMETLYSNHGQPGDANFCPVICHESFVSTL
jgi:F-box interacting protein